MILLPSIPPAIAAAVFAALISGGAMRTSSVRAGASVAFQVAEDPNLRCAAGRATSVAIPFERIIPNRVEHERPSDEYALRRGPRMLVVVDDSTQWPAIWHAALDSVKTPPIAFGNAVLVLATTQYWLINPSEFRITSIRQCRSTGFIVVSTV